MENMQFISLIGTLTFISLIVITILKILDFFKIESNQKIIFLKLSLIVIALAPVFFYLSTMHRLIIAIPANFTNSEPLQSLQIIQSTNQIHWSFYIVVIYWMGFCIMAWRIIFSYLIAWKQLLSSKKTYIYKYPVWLNKAVKTPISFGLLKAKIYFPFDAEHKWSSREIQICLAHEKIHIEHNDSFWKLLSLIVQALLFFSPWIYYLHKRFELEMEIVCDYKTCHETKADLQEYGNLLLAMACSKSNNFIFNNMTDSTLKRRFQAMKMQKRKTRYLVFISSAILILIGSTAISIASSTLKINNVYKIISKILIDGKVIASPVILAKENQKALIVLSNTNNTAEEGLRIELIANNATKFVSKNAINLNYDIQYKNGTEKFHSKPQVVVIPNQASKISLSSNSTHTYEMDIIAEKVNS